MFDTHSPSVDSGLPASLFSPGASENGSLQQLSTAIVKQNTSLGIGIAGGINRPDGPHIYVNDIMGGGDVYKVF